MVYYKYLSCNAESAIATCDPSSYYYYYRSNKHFHQITIFTYQQLLLSTNSFSPDNFLGKGSHGAVYKAILHHGKLTAAVKKTIHSNSTTNEIEILSTLQHPRLVNLIGFSSDESNHRRTKLLVVEYMPNGSLHSLIHSTTNVNPPGWTRRLRFALQVAKAVHALHSANPPVIHRDIKSSNVLIDENWKARLGDFGLALRGHVEDVRIRCTPPAGTLGYLDPGYLAPGDLTTKSDVFSFGILLLEIISGRNAIDVNYSPPSVVDWAVPLIKRGGDISAICDHRIGPPVDSGVIKDLAVLAAKCVRSTAEKRPSMADVVEGLKTLVRKRIHAPPLWSRLRRRVVRAENEAVENSISNEEVVKKKTVRRRNRKKSGVSSVEYRKDRIGLVIRSKSIGSLGEIKMGGLGPDSGSGPDHIVRRKVQAQRVAVVKLSKSKSTGVLRHCNTDSSVVSKLFIDLDHKSERQMQEKPLVSI